MRVSDFVPTGAVAPHDTSQTGRRLRAPALGRVDRLAPGRAGRWRTARGADLYLPAPNPPATPNVNVTMRAYATFVPNTQGKGARRWTLGWAER
jgi:hypothetical protein